MSKNRKIWAAASALAVVAGVSGYAMRAYWCKSCHERRVTAEETEVRQLLATAREHGEAALRKWFIAKGADSVHRAVLALDETNDHGGRVRQQSLRTIHSLSAEDLGDESIKAWAVALRSLANALFHDGPDRSDFIARSYLMEGRAQDAAMEYRRFPSSAASVTFFEEHARDHRVPANAKR